MRKHLENFAEKFVSSRISLSADIFECGNVVKGNDFYFAKQRTGGESKVIFQVLFGAVWRDIS